MANSWSKLGNIRGPQGIKGDKGDAATVRVGTVATGAAGSQATVTNSGTANAAVFDFSIPQGPKGDKGERGETGPQGPQGVQGEKGNPGQDADVAAAQEATKAANEAAAKAEQATQEATTAAGRANEAADKAERAAASHLLVWDEKAGEYTEESIRAWLAWGADGMQYGVDQPLDAVQECTKVLANAGIENPVPSTLLKVGSDPYWQRGPFRWWHVNARVDDDGTQHITGIKNFGHFSYEDGRDVFCLAPVRYVFHGVVGGKYRTVNCDMPQAGLSPEPRAYRPDGTLAPYMLRAAFPAGLVDGKPVSRPGVKLWNRTCSHNSMNEKAKLKGKAYSGMTCADMDMYL